MIIGLTLELSSVVLLLQDRHIVLEDLEPNDLVIKGALHQGKRGLRGLELLGKVIRRRMKWQEIVLSRVKIPCEWSQFSFYSKSRDLTLILLNQLGLLSRSFKLHFRGIVG